MKNILILTDFSKKSLNSINYVLSIFQKESCNFYLLHSIEGKKEGQNLRVTQALIEKEANQKFTLLKQKISPELLKGNHNCFPVITEKNILEATRICVTEKKIDLILIGTTGLCPNKKKRPNSISEDIITKVKCSVLVVPMEAKFNGINDVVIPTDFTNYSEAKLIQNLMTLSRRIKPMIRFLFLSKKESGLNKEQQWNKETLHHYFKDRPHSFHNSVNENFEVSMDNFIHNRSIDMAIMGAKNLNLFEQILFRPKIRPIHYYSKIPFLILH